MKLLLWTMPGVDLRHPMQIRDTIYLGAAIVLMFAYCFRLTARISVSAIGSFFIRFWLIAAAEPVAFHMRLRLAN